MSQGNVKIGFGAVHGVSAVPELYTAEELIIGKPDIHKASLLVQRDDAFISLLPGKGFVTVEFNDRYKPRAQAQARFFAESLKMARPPSMPFADICQYSDGDSSVRVDMNALGQMKNAYPVTLTAWQNLNVRDDLDGIYDALDGAQKKAQPLMERNEPQRGNGRRGDVETYAQKQKHVDGLYQAHALEKHKPASASGHAERLEGQRLAPLGGIGF